MTTKTDSTTWLCEECFDELGWAMPGTNGCYGTVISHNICSRCGGLAMLLADSQVLEPRRAAGGPAPRSVYTLAVAPRLVWDVNCYYRDLGVHPDATRAEIRHAYIEARGHESERLTFVTKQLLDAEIRRRYDAIPPGSFLFDRYLLAAVKREIHRQAAESYTEGEADSSVFEELAKELGQVVDAAGSRSNNVRAEREYRHPWRFYLWRTRRNDGAIRQWQELLLMALAEHKEVVEFAVGLAGDGMVPSWAATDIGSCVVVFLSDQEVPNLTLAQEIASNISKC